MTLAFLFRILQVFSQANAVVGCPQRIPTAQALGEAAQHLLQVKQIDDPDRMLVDEYAGRKGAQAKEVERAYAATGDLICAGINGQANLTITDNTITTAAHMLMPGKSTCVKPNNLNGCKVRFDIDGEKQIYEIDSLVDSGSKCPFKSGPRSSGTDWAILKLKKKVDPRIKPYKIDPDFYDNVVDNTPITIVAKSNDYPKQGNFKTLYDRPKHYGDCIDRTAIQYDMNADLITDCDGDHGSSGGGVFKRSQTITSNFEPRLIGIVSGGTEGKDKDCPIATRTQTSGKYQESCFSQVSTAVSGDFKTALQELLAPESKASPLPSSPLPKLGGPKYDDL